MSNLTVMPAALGGAKRRTRRLSVRRILLALVVVLGLTGASFGSWQYWNATRPVAAFSPWFAGYVDVTATPMHPFESPPTDASNNVMLSFVVAATEDPCAPSWGTYYSLESAAEGLDLDRRIARLSQLGGQVSVSFGGALNNELSTVCTNPNDLVAAYASVVERYNLSTIDLDIEGANLSDEAAGQRRAIAMKTLQENRASAGEPVTVWLTLPVATQGLTEEGMRVVTQMIDADVQLAGVNGMTMNYGGSRDSGESMAEASIRSLNALHAQLSEAYRARSIELTSAEVWTRMGATPMAGQNDVSGEVFSLADARALNRFAQSTQLGRLSMWSLNRDSTCGDNSVDLTVVSDACSGVDQKGARFADALAETFDGISGAAEVAGDAVPQGQLRDPAPEIIDDALTSPYVVWSEFAVFEKGTKIVWRGQVYESKWWSRDNQPDNPAVTSSDTPWKLLGPVLPTDVPRVPIVLPAGTYPEWSPGAIYLLTERVMLGDVPYESKWWTQGESPEASQVGESGGPWRLLTGAEVTAVTTGQPVVAPAAP